MKFALCSAIILAAPCFAQPTVEQVLARARDAIGTPAPGAISVRGHANFLGNDVPFDLTIHSDGRFVQRLGGPVPFAIGFDSTIAWISDMGGEVRPLELGEKTQFTLGTWMLTGRALGPDSPLTFTSAAEKDGSLVLEFTGDADRLTGSLQLDPATNLPRVWTLSTGASTSTLELSGDIVAAGLRLPRQARQSSTSGSATDYTIESAASADTPPAAFAKFGKTTPAKFDPAAPAALEVKKAKTGHLLVRPRIDGKELGWFIFDTGAGSNVIANSVAKELELKPIASVPATGVGGHVTTSMYRLGSVQLGPMTLDNSIMVGIELGFLDAPLGEHIAGIVGFGVLARAAAEIDADAATITLHDPAGYSLPRGAAWQELLLDHRTPATRASFEGHEGVFTIDTGASGHALVLMAPTTQRLKLLEGRETKDSMLGGVGGMVPAKVGKLATFDLAGVRHENLTVAFATERRGAFGNPYLDGNIAGKLIRQYTLVLDYMNGRLAFIPKGGAAAPDGAGR
ncbi:hypothetical protein PHYC_01802 [Phycisphaerales bacterium]|nr:hypothetical protein PHYC_01802 [Phycisphaerales bacterium]